jgi:hypothetical protein
VDDAQLVELFVFCVTTVSGQAYDCVVGVGYAACEAPLTPRVIRHAFYDCALFVGDDADAAQVVGVKVAQRAGLQV